MEEDRARRASEIADVELFAGAAVAFEGLEDWVCVDGGGEEGEGG